MRSQRVLNLCVAIIVCFSVATAAAGEPTPTNSPPGFDTVVVCPQQFAKSMKPWIRYRTSQGYRIAVVGDEADVGNAAELRDAIRSVAVDHPIQAILIVGDVPIVPTHFEPAVVNIKWGSEPEIATDNWFADLNDDAIPDVAIGRLCVDSTADLDQLIKKIIDYESKPIVDMWPRRVNLVAGVGGFGAIADAVLENATRSFITKGIPNAYRTSMTYASWRSPYCPDPREFRDATIDRLNEGSLLWIYMGHGHRRHLDWIRVPTGAAPILQSDDVGRVASRQGPPIAVFLSCYAGAFDDVEEDCLAERLVGSPSGPVAAICGSRITMPYAMAVMGNEMLRECFQERRATIGQILLNAKRRSVDSAANDGQRRILDALAKAISPDPGNLADERKEHLSLFNLIGDPLLKIRHPRPIDIEAPKSAFPGDKITIAFESAMAGHSVLELACPRGRFTFQPPKRAGFDGSDRGMAAMNAVYKNANQDAWLRQELATVVGRNSAELQISDDIKGPCHIRVFVQGADEFAIGSHAIYVRRKKPEPSSSN